MAAYFKEIAALDVTELPGLDDFHLPQGIIASGAALMAELVGAKQSFFLVNGATSGIQAFFLSLKHPRGKVLIPRNAHRSFLSGLIISGATPVFVPVQVEEETGIAWGVSRADVVRAYHAQPDLEAVFLVSPSYYGTCINIRGIRQDISKTFDGPLLVDEAQGGHFVFHPLYPQPALDQGADGVVQGLHKNWPVLNQGACLHIGEGYGEAGKLASAHSLLSTTSPSYPLLASIDSARAYLCRHGPLRLEQARLWSEEFRMKIDALPGFKIIQLQLKKPEEVIGLDPLKLVVGLDKLNLNGYQTGRLLHETYGIDIEMSGEHFFLAMMSMFHERPDWEKLFYALEHISAQYPGRRKKEPISVPPLPKQVLSPGQAFEMKKTVMPLENCVGQVAGEMVAAYPPGIPCLWPGEFIDETMRDYLRWVKGSGVHIQKWSGPTLEKVMVIDGAV